MTGRLIVAHDFPPWLILPFLFWLGACVGSFLNVCVYRIPQYFTLKDQLWSLSSQGSFCPKCRVPIRWYDNIPIFGWLSLWGRCRPADRRSHPVIRWWNWSTGCCLSRSTLWRCRSGTEHSVRVPFTPTRPADDPGAGMDVPATFVHLRMGFHLILIESLLVASLIDWDLMIIPDACTIPQTVFAVVASTIFGGCIWCRSGIKTRTCCATSGSRCPKAGIRG